MSVERLLSQFDLILSQDIVKDVQTTGVPFKKEIEGTGKRLLGCIILDKSDQDVVRFQFNGIPYHSYKFICQYKPLPYHI